MDSTVTIYKKGRGEQTSSGEQLFLTDITEETKGEILSLLRIESCLSSF
jgi:hypothetical protein